MNAPMTQKALIPMTGKEYLDSLNDDREVWIYGKRVKNITEHPAFRNSARMVARFYDAMHDPARKSILTTETEWGGYTHRYFRAPKTVAEQVAARDAVVNPELLAWHHSGEVLLMLILGGVGSLRGAVLGTVTFVLLKELLSTHAIMGNAADHWQLTLGLAIIALVALLPRGLVGINDKWQQKAAARKAPSASAGQQGADHG